MPGWRIGGSGAPEPLLAATGKRLYMSRALCMIPKSGQRFSDKIMLVNSVGFDAVDRALRLAVQDIALSRRKHGFDSRRARQQNQALLQSWRAWGVKWVEYGNAWM